MNDPDQIVVTAWMGFPPWVREQGELVFTLSESLLATLPQFSPIERIYSSEPRYYQPTPQGAAALSAALAAKHIDSLELGSPARPKAQSSQVSGSLHLGFSWRSDLAVTVGIMVQPAGIAPSAVADHLTSFVGRWFERLDAASAFVSYFRLEGRKQVGDAPRMTTHEEERGRTIPFQYEVLKRYMRGAFWGTGLGSELCQQLGGREVVLRDAPATISRRLGAGVWLQLSPEGPIAADGTLASLRHFLAPVLRWSPHEVRNLVAATPTPTLQADQPPGPTGIATHEAPRQRRRAVPVADAGDEGGLNIYLDTAPSPIDVASITATVADWFRDGVNEAFGGPLHELTGPVTEHTVMRWRIDFGTADTRRAVRDLSRRLGGLPGIGVSRLVVGVESAG